jgi:S1-C subfamily serine protease
MLAPDEQARRHRRRLRLMGVVGAGAAAAAVAGGALLWTSGSGQNHNLFSTDSVSVQTGSVPSAAVPATHSLVSLRVETAGHSVVVCGVAVAAGGLVAVPADSLRSARRIVFAGHGRQGTARLLSVDRTSGIALVKVPANLPTPRFSPDSTLATGSHVMVVTLGSTGTTASSTVHAPQTAPQPVWSIGSVEAVATPVSSGYATGLAGISVAAPSLEGVPGALLLDPGGAVLGILYHATTATSGLPGDADGNEMFLPEQLVVGVAREMLTGGTVHRGWLDVSGRNAPASSTAGGQQSVGVQVADVDPHGAAAGMLHPGDLIVGVSGAPVRTMAELRTLLYVLQPGTAVSLDVVRNGHTAMVTVVLGGSP